MTITHDALDLSVQGSSPPPWDLTLQRPTSVIILSTVWSTLNKFEHVDGMCFSSQKMLTLVGLCIARSMRSHGGGEDPCTQRSMSRRGGSLCVRICLGSLYVGGAAWFLYGEVGGGAWGEGIPIM